jgi:hypothetical protein
MESVQVIIWEVEPNPKTRLGSCRLDLDDWGIAKWRITSESRQA